MTEKTALVVIDVQVGVVDWPTLGPEGEAVLANINTLLKQARATGVPVIYVQDNDMGSPVGSPEWQIHPAIAPQPGEPVVNKLACDSFYETTLTDELTKREITRLVICGCRSQYCIDTSCRSAVARGYDVTLVSDAHMTMENGVISAAQIIAHTNRTLNGFGNAKHEIAVRPTAEVVLK
ncbi:MAG: cysteine hydrolase family protein [Pyrinomonadaceae bacterium]